MPVRKDVVNLSNLHSDRWRKDAVIAYNTKAYEGSFERYWAITAVLREGMSSKEVKEMRAIKLEAWNEQESSN